MHKAPHPILLLAATLVALPSLSTCRRSTSEHAVAERAPASERGAAPATVDAGAPARAIHPALPDAAAPDAAVTAPYNASSGDCPVSVDAARVHLAHRAAWSKTWSERPPDCKDACVVNEHVPPDAERREYRYHLVIPAQGGGFDVIENLAFDREPGKCGQWSAWETVMGGEPLHVHVTYLLTAGMAFVDEVNDAGDVVVNGWHCAHEGSESDLTDFFIDRARHERVLLVKQHNSGGDEAEVTVAGGFVRIHGAGCDEQRSMGVRP
jgi:hypothetical protein